MSSSQERLESQRLEVALLSAALPVVVLLDQSESAYLGECDYYNEQLRLLEIVYGVDRPRAVIQIVQAPDGPVFAFPPYRWPGWSGDEEVEILLDGRQTPAVRRTGADGWMLRVLVSYDDEAAAVVTVTGYGWTPDGLSLKTLTDPLPLIQERNRLRDERWETIQELMREETRKTAPYPAAYRKLADLVVQRRRSPAEPHTFARRLPVPPPGPGWRNLWKLVRSTQAGLRGQSEEEAGAAVRSLVQHVGRLAGSAPWFDQAELADTALMETIEWMAHRAEVPSRAAQLAWERVHEHESAHPLRALVDSMVQESPPEPGELESWSQERASLTEDWERAWADWAQAF